MRIKICLLVSLLYSIGTCVYADAIVNRKFPAKRSAIQSSTYSLNQLEHSSYNNDLMQSAIKELQQKISQNPTDYTLNANLANLYLNSYEYEKAFKEFTYLLKLNNQNKLNTNTKNELLSIYNKQKNNLKYEKYKSLSYANLAILALITNNINEAENYIIQAASTGSSSDIITEGIDVVFDNSADSKIGIEACNRIINKNPNSYSARKLKAKLLKNSNNIDEAIKEYATAIGLNPKDNETKYELYKILESKNVPEKDRIGIIYSARPIKSETAFYDIANILLENDDVSGAKYYANVLAKISPDKAQGYMLLSEIYRREGKLKESYEALSEGKDKVNDKEEAKNYNVQLAKLSNDPLKEAISLMRSGLFEQANDIIKTANQDNLDVLLLSATINYNLKNKQIAFDCLNKAMTLYPQRMEVYANFADIYTQEQDFDTARKYLNEAKKIAPNNDNLILLSKFIDKEEAKTYLPKVTAAFDMENFEEAEKIVDEALKLSAEIAEIQFYKGVLQIAKHNYAGSTAYLYKCLEIDKNYYLAYFYLAIVFDNLSEHENALINYQKFVETIPKDTYDETEKINYSKLRIEKLKG